MPISKIPVGAIQSGTIATTQIADNAVTTAKILDDNVTSAKIPNDAVGSTEIASSAITRDELQSAAVNNISSDSIILNSTNGTADAGDFLVLDGTDGSSSNANHRILYDETFVDKIGLFNINTLGSAGQAVKVNTGGTGLEFGSAGVYESALFHIQNEHATHQSTTIGTSYTDFIFNTVKTNEISGASLSSNEVTLPSGTYFADIMICTARCNAFVSRLYNTADSSLVLEGALMYNDTSHTNNLISFIKGRFTIAAQKTFKIQASAQTSASTYGQGYSQSSSSTLSTIWMNRTALFWKVA